MCDFFLGKKLSPDTLCKMVRSFEFSYMPKGGENVQDGPDEEDN